MINFDVFEGVCQENNYLDDLDSDGIPDDLDDDRDGDGIANQMEELAGTDADDPASVPADDDSDGIPNVLEINNNNVCLATFNNGLQTHSNKGRIEFGHDARLIAAPSNYLSTFDIRSKKNSDLLTCDFAECEALRDASPPV